MPAKKIAVIEESDEREVKLKPLEKTVSKEEVVKPSEAKPNASDESQSQLPKPEKEAADSSRHIPLNVSKRSFKKIVRYALIFVLVILFALAGVHLLSKPKAANPLPTSVKQKINFTLYYPQSTNGYKFVKGSDNYSSGKLTYILNTQKGGPFIRVSEVALTGQAPDLHKLTHFSFIKTPVGEAAYGPSGNIMNGVLIANKTIVILNGLGGVSAKDFVQTIKSMEP